jgi:non-ribosomal peptide synthetase-like protein
MLARTAARSVLDLPLVIATLLGARWLGIEGAQVALWLRDPSFDARIAWSMLGLLAVHTPFMLLLEALVVRGLSPSRSIVIERWSAAYARVWIATDLTDAAGNWLSGTLFWPMWLRLAGMKIGRNCEISTLIDLVPALVEIGDETFLADGIYLGGPRVRGGHVTLERTVLGGATFVGNHAVIPAGVRLPPEVLIGVSTVADPKLIRAPGVWFGHPPFHMARKTPVDFGRNVTHEPGLVRRVTRVFWEVLRFALPIPIAALGMVWFAAVDAWSFEGGGLRNVMAVGAATLVCAFAAWLALVALKWSLLGRVQPGKHPLWSCWCSRWDFLYVAWGMIARNVLTEIEGTLLLNAALRAFGMRIGAKVLLGAGFAQVVDPDMLTFEDGATVNGNFQAHTFEDRVLKIGHVVIRRDATVGAHAVLFYGSDIGAAARVAPHGVVLKGERLTAGRDFAGVPTQPV